MPELDMSSGIHNILLLLFFILPLSFVIMEIVKLT
jgi:hypothetical protein